MDDRNVLVTPEGVVPMASAAGSYGQRAWQDNMIFDSREAAMRYAVDYVYTWPTEYEWLAVWSAGTGSWLVNAKRADGRREY